MALKNLFDNYMEFGEIINDNENGTVDLENLDFNPTTVLPLLCLCKSRNLKLENGEDAFEYLEDILENNRLFSKLPKSRGESDESDFLSGYVENLDSEYGSYFVLRHIISELSNNVYDHSRFKNLDVESYIFAKEHPNTEKLDISIVDDGISIPGLFEKSNVDFENDCQAIEKAIGTFSTVSDNDYERGNGLRTVVRLIAEGNGGEILIVSRSGCLHISGENYVYYLFDEGYSFNGTLVSIRLNKYEVQNIYDLLEYQKFNNYKYEGANYDYYA